MCVCPRMETLPPDALRYTHAAVCPHVNTTCPPHTPLATELFTLQPLTGERFRFLPGQEGREIRRRLLQSQKAHEPPGSSQEATTAVTRGISLPASAQGPEAGRTWGWTAALASLRPSSSGCHQMSPLTGHFLLHFSCPLCGAGTVSMLQRRTMKPESCLVPVSRRSMGLVGLTPRSWPLAPKVRDLTEGPWKCLAWPWDRSSAPSRPPLWCHRAGKGNEGLHCANPGQPQQCPRTSLGLVPSSQVLPVPSRVSSSGSECQCVQPLSLCLIFFPTSTGH